MRVEHITQKPSRNSEYEHSQKSGKDKQSKQMFPLRSVIGPSSTQKVKHLPNTNFLGGRFLERRRDDICLCGNGQWQDPIKDQHISGFAVGFIQVAGRNE